MKISNFNENFNNRIKIMISGMNISFFEVCDKPQADSLLLIFGKFLSLQHQWSLYSVQAEASSGNNHLLHFRFQHSDHLFSCIQMRRIRRNCYSSNSISLYSLDHGFRFVQCCLSMIMQTFSLPFFSHIFIQTSLINQ